MEIGDTTGEKILFVSIRITRVVLFFRKISKTQFWFKHHTKQLLKIQLIFLFFEVTQDIVEEVLVLMRKLLRELKSPLKKYIVQAAKKTGANLIEVTAPEIGEIVSGRKKLKTFVKEVGPKTVRKNLRVEKKSKRRASRAR